MAVIEKKRSVTHVHPMVFGSEVETWNDFSDSFIRAVSRYWLSCCHAEKRHRCNRNNTSMQYELQSTVVLQVVGEK